jgi:hypothetical protein
MQRSRSQSALNVVVVSLALAVSYVAPGGGDSSLGLARAVATAGVRGIEWAARGWQGASDDVRAARRETPSCAPSHRRAKPARCARASRGHVPFEEAPFEGHVPSSAVSHRAPRGAA